MKNEICKITLSLLKDNEVDMKFEWQTGYEKDIGDFLFRIHSGQLREPMTGEIIESSQNIESTEQIIDYLDGLFDLQEAFKTLVAKQSDSIPVIRPTKVFSLGDKSGFQG